MATSSSREQGSYRCCGGDNRSWNLWYYLFDGKNPCSTNSQSTGMCMAIDLIKRNQCHNFIIVEKSSSIGGTWHDNKYPGCCCDVWSMLYSYSFEQNPDWTREYPGQEEILDYLRNVAQKYQLYKYIRFNTSVEAATWDDQKNRWKVDVKVTGGKDAEFNPEYTIETDFLVSAVGQLNQPRYPDIEGLENFKGKIMHSARWDWSYSLEGKKVGIIGNGMCSPGRSTVSATGEETYRWSYTDLPQAQPQHKSFQKFCHRPQTSPSTNAPQTGSFPASTAPYRHSAAQYTAISHLSAGASAVG